MPQIAFAKTTLGVRTLLKRNIIVTQNIPIHTCINALRLTKNVGRLTRFLIQTLYVITTIKLRKWAHNPFLSKITEYMNNANIFCMYKFYCWTQNVVITSL